MIDLFENRKIGHTPKGNTERCLTCFSKLEDKHKSCFPFCSDSCRKLYHVEVNIIKPFIFLQQTKLRQFRDFKELEKIYSEDMQDFHNFLSILKSGEKPRYMQTALILIYDEKRARVETTNKKN